MVTTVLTNETPAELHLFRNYAGPERIAGYPAVGGGQNSTEPEQQRVWEAARATGSAPIYFR